MENINLQLNSTGLTDAVSSRTDVANNQIQQNKVPPAEQTYSGATEYRNQDEARFAAIKQAAEQISSRIQFPVSDVRFTIYKDKAPGSEDKFVYVTRFTSLRDGRVTIVPEPDLLANVGKASGTILETLV